MISQCCRWIFARAQWNNVVSSINMSGKAPVVPSASIANKLNFGKKRQARVAEWLDNKRKKLRNSGQSYISRKGEEVMSKKRPEEEFSCSCRYPECRKISIEEKKKFFDNFYKVNYDEQSQFLKGCIEIKEPTRRTAPEATSRRHCSVKYTVQLNKRVQVCQKSLCNMLDITKRRLEILLQKIKCGDNIRDQRGKHLNRPHKIKNVEIDTINEHISSFPFQENHYSRMKNDVVTIDKQNDSNEFQEPADTDDEERQAPVEKRIRTKGLKRNNHDELPNRSTKHFKRDEEHFRKSCESHLVELPLVEGLQSTNSTIQTVSKRDEYSVYGEHVSNKLRNCARNHIEIAIAQNKIDNILFDLSMGSFSQSFYGRSQLDPQSANPNEFTRNHTVSNRDSSTAQTHDRDSDSPNSDIEIDVTKIKADPFQSTDEEN